jgi:ATP-dependent DNA ligase
MESFLVKTANENNIEKKKRVLKKKDSNQIQTQLNFKIKETEQPEESKPVNEVIPSFPKLYQLNNNHKIYEWSIRIEKSSGDSYDIITAHGEKDGKQVPHIKNIDKGKVKRSVLEQAVLEAESKWKNKKEKDLYCESIEETTNNVEENVIVRPMLANTFSFDVYNKGGRGFKISLPAYVQRKYDGIRCIAYLKNGEVVLESRKGIPFQNFEELRKQLKIMLNKQPSTFYFDGELYTNKYDFEVLCGLVRLTEKKVKNEDKEKINQIEYHIYDFVNTSNIDMKYKQRFEFLESFLTQHSSIELIKRVPTEEVNTLNDIKTKHDLYIQEGYEGIMIRDTEGPYEVQKRSKFLQKYKEFMEEEFKIIGFSEGTSDEKGCVLWNCETKNGSTFTVRPKGTKESRMELFANGSKYINKLLTVIFQEYSSDGIPRFPVGKGIRDIY